MLGFYQWVNHSAATTYSYQVSQAFSTKHAYYIYVTI